MRASLTRSLLALAWPALIPVLAAAACVHLESMAGGPEGLWTALPYLAGGAAVALGWRFNRSRAVLTASVVLLAGIGLGQGVDAAWVAVLLPLDVALFVLLGERGLLTFSGLFRWALVGAQVLLVRASPEPPPWLVASLVAFEVPSPLPQAGLAAFALAALVVASRFARRRGALESGLLGVLAAMLLALHSEPGAIAYQIYWCTAGLVLAFAVVETGHTLAFRDELTDLPGRRALMEAVERLSGRYTMAMVDVDHFKKFNDKHGHDAGDDVLRLVAARLARVTGGGRVYRYGGEEFTVVFPGRDMEETLPHLEALCRGVAGSKFTVRAPVRPRKKPVKPRKPRRPKRLSVTVSLGVAERAGREPPAEVLKRADKKLYAAKKAGRNQVAS